MIIFEKNILNSFELGNKKKTTFVKEIKTKAQKNRENICFI